MGKQQVDLSVWLERRMMKQIIRGRGTQVREIDLKLKDFGYYAKKKKLFLSSYPPVKQWNFLKARMKHKVEEEIAEHRHSRKVEYYHEGGLVQPLITPLLVGLFACVFRKHLELDN